MVEMCCSRDGPKEDASTSDDDKEAEGSGENDMWQGRQQSRSIITGKDGRAQGSDEGSKQISSTIGKALRRLFLSKAECID
jgi:hypothetical protein